MWVFCFYVFFFITNFECFLKVWVKKVRTVLGESYFYGKTLQQPKSPAKNPASQRSSRDMDDTSATTIENEHDRCSLASFGSGNTTDSDNKVGAFLLLLWGTRTFYLTFD